MVLVIRMVSLLSCYLKRSRVSDTINTLFVERKNSTDRGQNSRKRESGWFQISSWETGMSVNEAQKFYSVIQAAQTIFHLTDMRKQGIDVYSLRLTKTQMTLLLEQIFDKQLQKLKGLAEVQALQRQEFISVVLVLSLFNSFDTRFQLIQALNSQDAELIESLTFALLDLSVLILRLITSLAFTTGENSVICDAAVDMSMEAKKMQDGLGGSNNRMAAESCLRFVDAVFEKVCDLVPQGRIVLPTLANINYAATLA